LENILISTEKDKNSFSKSCDKTMERRFHGLGGFTLISIVSIFFDSIAWVKKAKIVFKGVIF